MLLTPSLKIGVGNAWLFMIVFPLQWLVVLAVPKHIAERTRHPPDFTQTHKGKVMGRATEILWIGATLYSIFLPLGIGTTRFYAGLGVFVIGVIVLISATLVVERTPAHRPFTGGAYRFSRHPMYLSMILVYTSVCVASASLLFLLITLVTLYLLRFQMIQEEAHCREKFGHIYMEYWNRTPRWMGIPKSGNRK